jgi:hypothetical protein
MRSPVVKRQTTPVSGFFAFFPLFQGRRRQQPVSCPDFISVWVQRPCGCTKHVWRLCHHGHGECRGTSAWSSAASKFLGALVPSYAKRRLSGDRSPVSARLGGGAAHVNQTRLSPQTTAPERVANQPPRAQGAWPLCSWAVTDAERHLLPSPRSRLTPCPSSEALGSPAPRTTHGETGADRTPCAV